MRKILRYRLDTKAPERFRGHTLDLERKADLVTHPAWPADAERDVGSFDRWRRKECPKAHWLRTVKDVQSAVPGWCEEEHCDWHIVRWSSRIEGLTERG
jgi:hypothetical protein